jgi:hypothetical protein
VEYRQFEREFLRIAFTTTLDLSPSALAFATRLPIAEVEKHMQRLIAQGVLEVTSDEDGHLRYLMPDRPAKPLDDEDAAPGGVRVMVSEHVGGGPPPPYPDPPFVAPPRAVVVHRGVALSHEPQEVTHGQAVAAMLLNAMVCPGVGSIVGGRARTGLSQLALFMLGLPLIVVAIGLPMIVAAWIWGLTTGAQLLTEARGTG